MDGPYLLLGPFGRYRAPALGSFCYLVHQALKGPLWLGSFSKAQRVRCFKGPPSLGPFSCLADMWGERGIVMAPLPVCDSAVSPDICVHLACFHMHFPLRSPPAWPCGTYLHIKQQSLPLVTLQSRCSSPQLLHSLGDFCPYLGYTWL